MRFDPDAEHADVRRWKIAAVAIALLAVAAMVLVLARRSGDAGHLIGHPGMFPQRGPITSLAELARDPRAASHDGKHAILADVAVEAVLGEHVFLIGDDAQRVPVVLFGELAARQRASVVELAPGDRVLVYGLVRPAPGAAPAADLAPLEPSEVASLRAHALYISAFRVVPLSGRGRTAVPRVITTIEQLSQFEPARLEARDVVLDRVRVVRVIGDYTFLVGDAHAVVPVILFGELTGRQPEERTEIRAGQDVRIFGIARRLRSPGDLEPSWSLTGAEAAELRAHSIYISALRVTQLEPPS